jgi:hypothetical protein
MSGSSGSGFLEPVPGLLLGLPDGDMYNVGREPGVDPAPGGILPMFRDHPHRRMP